MLTNIVKLKGVLVSACDANKKGHKDIFANLMEIASDLVEDMSPEDIDTHMFAEMDDSEEVIVPDMDGLPAEEILAEEDTDAVNEVEENTADDSGDNDDDDVEMANHGSQLRNILARVGRPAKVA